MEDKVRLSRENIATCYWLDDVTFLVEFKEVPKHLALLYDVHQGSNYELYAEYWTEDDSFHYVLKLEDKYHVINQYIDRWTNWLIRELCEFEEN